MSKFKPHTVYLLAILLFTNASAWAFNPEVWADLNPNQHQSNTSTSVTTGTDSDSTANHSDETCSHGCHSISHLIGQVVQVFNLTIDKAGMHPLSAISFFLPHSAEPQFRPPQFLS
jgi:hypothetical protein